MRLRVFFRLKLRYFKLLSGPDKTMIHYFFRYSQREWMWLKISVSIDTSVYANEFKWRYFKFSERLWINRSDVLYQRWYLLVAKWRLWIISSRQSNGGTISRLMGLNPIKFRLDVQQIPLSMLQIKTNKFVQYRMKIDCFWNTLTLRSLPLESNYFCGSNNLIIVTTALTENMAEWFTTLRLIEWLWYSHNAVTTWPIYGPCHWSLYYPNTIVNLYLYSFVSNLPTMYQMLFAPITTKVVGII